MPKTILRRTVTLLTLAAIIAAVREAMLRHHERDFRVTDRREP